MCLCKECGNSVPPQMKVKYGNFCSARCYERWQKFNNTPNCKCTICGMPIYVKPSRLKRVKHGITCSKQCAHKLKSQYMKGDKNHQYGITGDSNVSLKNGLVKTNYGYLLEYAPGHPFPHDSLLKTTRVLQHRLVVEKHYLLFDKNAFVVINGKHYLKKEYVVHHINHIKTDNRIENLQVMTLRDHTQLHNAENKVVRKASNDKIIGVFKSGKNDELWEGNIVLTFSNCARWRKQCRA